MKKQYQSPVHQFERIIGYASIILDKPHRSIEKTFSDLEISTIEYINKGVYEKLITIELQTSHLICIINSDDKCQASTLYFDNNYDAERFIKYCNDLYFYNDITEIWSLTNCYLTQKVSKEHFFYFLFFKK